MAIPSNWLLLGGAALAGGSMLLATQYANSQVPPPDPNEDVEYDASAAVDLTPYYVAGFVGAVLFGAGLVLTIRGKTAAKIPVVG